MLIGSGDTTYTWNDDWAEIPNPGEAKGGWSHHGVVVTEAGHIIASHPATPDLLEFDQDGKLLGTVPTPLTECHGLTLVKEGDSEFLWIADIGRKRHKVNGGYEYIESAQGPKVVKMSLSGETVMTLGRPEHPAYETGTYTPTWVAVNEERSGGNGDIWVADGYGENYVHRFDKSGSYIGGINGEEGQTGAFDGPHTAWVDTRKDEPELYIGDRSSGRIQVYDLEGIYKRSFGSEWSRSPTGFASHGDLMIIIELNANMAIVDLDDNLVVQIGTNRSVCEVDGWPNVTNANGETVRTHLLETGKFNSPHGVATDADGNIYVSEWLIGGRYIKLAK